MNAERRPDPDALLAATRPAGRGRLKLFLGAAPGVGKTCAMLNAARLRHAAGEDVLIGLVETHGRADTAALVDGLPIWARRPVAGSTGELDVDGLLARRPALLLVDEYAHSNAAGSRHLKRHQDIEDLRSAGIEVWSTLNIQHLESLNDAVARMTGVRVRETVPDAALAGADEVELIDLPPESLIERLRAGKVYPPVEAERALERYFQPGNLLALRELALRTTAERVDADVDAWLRRHPGVDPWPTLGRMLVCIGDDGQAQGLVRAASRLARQRQVPWIAVHVLDSRAADRSDEAKDRVAAALRLAESLGGESLTIPGEEIADELLAFARSRNLSQILVGRPSPRWRPWQRSVARRLLAAGRGLDITWIDVGATTGATVRPSPPQWPQAPDRRALLETAGLLTLVTGIAQLLTEVLAVADLPMLYLIAVLLVGVRHGRVAASATALLSFFLVNFLFTEPRFTLAVSLGNHVVTLLVFVVIALAAGQFAAQIRSQMEALRKTARRTANLNEFSRRLTRVRDPDEAADALVRHVAATLDTAAVVVRDPPTQRLQTVARVGIGAEFMFRDAEVAAARWCVERGQRAGAWTATLPASRWLFAPLAIGARVYGAVGLDLQPRGRPLSPGQSRLLDAITDQAAVALERLQLGVEVEQRRVDQQTEQVRSALLASVSHDLRTPLAAIMGSASTLVDLRERLGEAERAELAENILEGSRRLDRHVQNLLDMTRLSHGQIAAHPEPVRLRDAFADAVATVCDSLGAGLDLDGLEALPEAVITADRSLLRSLLVNLIENAVRHGGEAVRISVEAARVGRYWRLTLRDDGPGLPPARLARPFEPFAGAGERDHRRAGRSTGLGLSICLGIATLHGATLDIRNGTDGRGCHVVLNWPVADADASR